MSWAYEEHRMYRNHHPGFDVVQKMPRWLGWLRRRRQKAEMAPTARRCRMRQGVEIVVPIGARPCEIRDFSIRDSNGVLLVFGQDGY